MQDVKTQDSAKRVETEADRFGGFCLTQVSVGGLIVAAMVVSAILWLAIWGVL